MTLQYQTDMFTGSFVPFISELLLTNIVSIRKGISGTDRSRKGDF